MAMNLKCIACMEGYFGEREPMGLPCGHTVCRICINQMVKTTYRLQCPYDRQTTTDAVVIRNLKPNYQIKESMASIEVCCEVDNVLASDFCMTHFEPLCAKCIAVHTTCEKKDILEDSTDISFGIVVRIRELANSMKLPQTLVPSVKNVSKVSLNEKVILHRKLRKLAIGDMSDDPRFPIMNQVREDVKKISSCLLTSQMLEFIFRPPVNIEECRQFSAQLHSLVDVEVRDDSQMPDYVYCMKCFVPFLKLDLNMLVLPCFKVFHLICIPCAQASVSANTVVCGLDSRSFSISDINKLPKFDIGPSKEHGNKINYFGGFPGFVSSVDLFKHIQPHITIAPDRRTGNYQGYVVDCGSNQVEAITFSCFRDVTLGGIGITNPVENSEALTIEWVKIYVGTSGKDNLRMTTGTTPNALVGGNMLHTDLQLNDKFSISAFNNYTLKLKLVRNAGPGKVLMYRGNHLTRVENPRGTVDEYAWEFTDTVGLEPNERCLGQHYLTGPILRLIYS